MEGNDVLNDVVAITSSFGNNIPGVELIQEPVWLTGLELFNMKVEKVDTLIGDIIPRVGLFSVVGASDTGKSMFLRQMGLAIVQEKEFLSFPINAIHKKVAFVSSEDGESSVAFLIRKQSQGNSYGLENISFFFESDNVLEEIETKISKSPVDLIIADAWGDMFDGNQNDSGQIRQRLNQYKALSVRYNCAIGILHHTGKRTEKLIPSKNNILAGQGFEAKMRLVIELRNDIEDETYRHLCIVKGNYLGKEYKDSSYKLEFDPDHFVFHDTGERVKFDDLATVTDAGAPVKVQPKKASEVDALTHKNILEQVFSNNLKPKLQDLKTRLSSKYSEAFGTVFGGRRVDAYLDYFLNDMQWIIKVGKDRSPNTYYYLGLVTTTDNTTDDA